MAERKLISESKDQYGLMTWIYQCPACAVYCHICQTARRDGINPDPANETEAKFLADVMKCPCTIDGTIWDFTAGTPVKDRKTGARFYVCGVIVEPVEAGIPNVSVTDTEKREISYHHTDIEVDFERP